MVKIEKNDIDHDFHGSISDAPKETETTNGLDQVEEISNVIEEDMQDYPRRIQFW